ncbi:MAG: ABC transporter permease [Candidatus Melainabacteria bacterium]|nr:ABC transporter permease [Candidatus Melainabacteria bacterium]
MINWQVVAALGKRYIYIYSRNSFRILDIVFWPVMDLLVWGWVSAYMMTSQKGLPQMATFLIGAIILFNILLRVQQGITVSFLEDIWSRNLLNVFAAPVRASEFVAATYLVGLTQALAVMCVMSVAAYFIYGFSVSSIGWTLIPLFLNLLMMGWSLGLCTTALILRFGNQAEALAWAVPFLIQPLSAVFYPVSILPKFLQPISYCLPAAHVFEGMREVLQQNKFPQEHLIAAAVLNVIYMTLSGFFFAHMFKEARRKGLISKLVV